MQMPTATSPPPSQERKSVGGSTVAGGVIGGAGGAIIGGIAGGSKGARRGALVSNVALVPRQFLRAINWVVSGKVSAQKMITKRFGLDQVEEASEAQRQGETVKVLFGL